MCVLTKFVDDTKVGHTANAVDGWIIIQNLDNFVQWSIKNEVKLISEKCEVMC